MESLESLRIRATMKYCLRNMKCPSDMKLLRNEVKFAHHVRQHTSLRSNFISRSDTSLARKGKFH